MLEDSGYYVKTSATPENALRLVSEETFDIVFLDQFLGAATGLGLMKQMAVINPELYFVIITANGSADLAVESLKKGASDFITKPFFIADMIKSIEYVNKKRELNRQKKDLLMTLESKVNAKTEEIRMMHFSVLSSLAQAMEKETSALMAIARESSTTATCLPVLYLLRTRTSIISASRQCFMI